MATIVCDECKKERDVPIQEWIVIYDEKQYYFCSVACYIYFLKRKGNVDD